MTDRELLELAAKAAGLMIHEERQAERDALIGPEKAGLCIVSVSTWWNPLTDDGDALRLAVKCKIDVVQFSQLVRADVAGLPDVREQYNGDPYAATRRAIVMAAAELGRSMTWTTLREAATHALEALESAVEYDYHGTPLTETHAGFNDAATALRTALAEKALHIDTLRMAREAGFAVEDGGVYTPDAYGPGDVTQLVKRFADLVSAAERERNAQIADAHASIEGIAQLIAAEIRGQV